MARPGRVDLEWSYKPSCWRGGLRDSRSPLIGIIARDISNPFHIQILRRINNAARAGAGGPYDQETMERLIGEVRPLVAKG